MATGPELFVEAAQAAVAAGDWAAARRAFEVLVAGDPTPESLAGLGDVLWWLGETDQAVRYQERAYAGFQHRGDSAGGAMAAVGLYLIYRVSLGNTAAARGWLARAARVVSEAGLASMEGWVVLLRAHDSADPVTAERWAVEAQEVAVRFGDIDLELCALSQWGASLVRQGRGEEGTRLLDEAMAAALAGESRRPHTVVYTSCNLISACAQTAELDHAMQWIRAADDSSSGMGTRISTPPAGPTSARSCSPPGTGWARSVSCGRRWTSGPPPSRRCAPRRPGSSPSCALPKGGSRRPNGC